MKVSSTFNLLCDKSPYPTVVTLKANDCGRHHAGAVLNNASFDGAGNMQFNERNFGLVL